MPSPQLPPDTVTAEGADEFFDQMLGIARWAGEQIRRGVAYDAFAKNLTKALPKLLPMVLEMAPDQASRNLLTREIGGLLANSIWNVAPQPQNNFRVVPVAHPSGQAPCVCGSGQALTDCCLAGLAESLVITGEMMLVEVLQDWPTARIDEIPRAELPPLALAMTADRWAQAGRVEEAVLLLAPLFAADSVFDARHVSALHILIGLYLATGREAEKTALLARVAASGAPELRSIALQREASVLADQGQWSSAWAKFNAAATLTPDDLTLAALELTLLFAEGRGDEAAQRFASRTRQWQDDLDGEEKLETLRTVLVMNGIRSASRDPGGVWSGEAPPAPKKSAKVRRPRKAARPAAGSRWQIRIALENVEPAVWRRVVVNDNLSFGELHAVIQVAMGWDDSHLHQFECAKRTIGPASAIDDFGGEPMEEEDAVRLGDLPKQTKKIRYWYDFGDDWWHTLSIEKRLPAVAGAPAVELLAGANACPPEDCGGPWGYGALLQALANPAEAEDPELLDYYGDFDPAAFTPDDSQKRLLKLARRWV